MLAGPGQHVDGPRSLALPDAAAALMATTQQEDAGSRLIQVAIYPLDWLEERSGLVGGVKYFLFRKVPSTSRWFHTLGSATLTAFLVQALTGVILAMYYKPDPDKAYESIQHITNDLTLGWLVRGMHRWGASVFIILMFLHMARVFLFGAYKYPRELNWIIGVLLLATGMFEGFTGYLLPWDQTVVLGDASSGSTSTARRRSSGRSSRRSCAEAPRSGRTRSRRFYSLHMLLIPGALFALIGLHLYLVIRLGVSPNPWSPERPAPSAASKPSAQRPDARPRGGSGRWRPLDERRAGFKRYKEDVDARGKPFFPYAMFHDTVMSLVVVVRDRRARRDLEVDARNTTGDDYTGWLGAVYNEQGRPRDRRTSCRGPTGTSTSSSTCCGSSSGPSR